MSERQSQDEKPPRRVYGRRLGRPLRPERLDVLETLLPRLGITQDELSAPGVLTPARLFGQAPPATWLEIGFGNGEHLLALMEDHPDDGFIAAEPFVNGMSAFLKSIKDKPHERMRVLMDDAILIADALADGCIDGIYVLNPDPWPKKRHFKRRIISPENLTRFARILKPGGLLMMTTDVDELAEWMATQAANHPAFTWTAESAADWRTPPPGWRATRYESKGARAGRLQTYLVFKRI